MNTIQINLVSRTKIKYVKFLSLRAVNLDADDDSYGYAEVQILDTNEIVLDGKNIPFTRAESDEHWTTDEAFYEWLVENKLEYTVATP